MNYFQHPYGRTWEHTPKSKGPPPIPPQEIRVRCDSEWVWGPNYSPGTLNVALVGIILVVAYLVIRITFEVIRSQ